MGKKIILFSYSLNIGGTQRMMLNLANQMAKNGLDVFLVVCRGGNGELSSEADARIHVIDLRVTGNTFFTLSGFIRLLRKIKPQAVLSALPNINLVAIWAVRMSGINTRLVVSERNHLSTQIANSNQLSARLRPWLYRAFYPWADGIVAVSKGVADDLAEKAQIPREKIHVIYNPVNIPKIQLQAHKPVDHPWLINHTTPIILSVGRLHEQKDHITLLMAFKLLLDHMPARLIILGEGPLRSKLENMIADLSLKEHVNMPGEVINPYAYMEKSDVFVLSSAWEGFPNVLVEAMACGTPVVATNCPSGPAEILENGLFGQLVPVRDKVSLADALILTIQNPLPEKKIFDRAKDFSPEKSLNRYLQCLNLPLP